MRGLEDLRNKSKLDITIAFTRSGRKCWLLKPCKEMPFRERITSTLTRKQMGIEINNLLNAEKSRC